VEEMQWEFVVPKLAVSHEVKRLCVLDFPEFESMTRLSRAVGKHKNNFYSSGNHGDQPFHQ